MSEKELRAMIDDASQFCAKQFARKGEVLPLWHAVAGDGEQLILPPPCEDKDAAAALIRALFELRDVRRYVYMSEAWTLARRIEPDEFARIQHAGVSAHPERIEVVMLMGEDRDCGQIMAERRIVRPANRRAYLEPLRTLIDLPRVPRDSTIRSEGRLIGLLPVRGTRQ
jgi:hypothetical protein